MNKQRIGLVMIHGAGTVIYDTPKYSAGASYRRYKCGSMNSTTFHSQRNLYGSLFLDLHVARRLATLSRGELYLCTGGVRVDGHNLRRSRHDSGTRWKRP